MLTVIIDARTEGEGLPALLAQLTAGAVDGLVRQVLIVAASGEGAVDLLCEEMGAEAHPTIGAAVAAARAERLLILPACLRLRDGWISSIGGYLSGGGVDAVVVGQSDGRLFARRPLGLLVERGHVARSGEHADLQHLRRRLGRRRIG